MTGGARAPESERRLVALPKIDLHCHLDGALRPGTLLELARAAGLRLPADDVEGLLPHVRVAPGCRSLREFLLTFEAFYPVLRAPGAMRRAACELLEDAAADGVLHVEVRCCPALQASEHHDARAVLAEVLAGLAEGERDHGVSWGLVLCCYRSEPRSVNAALAALAVEHVGRGVVGLDLAGPEDLSGAGLADLFARARDAGLGLTVHAGEAAGPASVVEAVDMLGAQRLGHGVAAAEDAGLLRRLADAGVVFECCLTSNLHTAAVADLAAHPFEALRRAGQRVTLNTDDPAVSGITLSGEFGLAARQWGLGRDELLALTHTACAAAFLDQPARARLSARLAARVAAAADESD